jgi:hypothetical protein
MTTTTTMTPADFRPATMVALAEQCGWRADFPVSFKPVIAKALGYMGLDEDSLGINDATKQSQTSRNCQMAFKYAADNGRGLRGKRGQWGLTEEGINEARGHAGTFGVTPPLPSNLTATTTTAAPVTMPTQGVSVALGRVTIADAYHPDAYIRSVAVAQTPCFGGWSAQAATCKGCPLASSCRNMVAARASMIAARLIKHGSAPAAPAAASGTVPSKAEGTSTAGVSQTMLDAFKDADAFVNRTDATCVVCGKDIAPKEEALWAERIGTDPGGVAHIKCGQPNR